jgi:hypothetical protein
LKWLAVIAFLRNEYPREKNERSAVLFLFYGEVGDGFA